MTSAVDPIAGADHTELRHILTRAAVLGVFQSVLVAAFALVSRALDGPVEVALEAVILVVGVAATIALPGTWTRARSIEGIAGAAAIGLAATVVFLIIDVALFQPLGLYSNRWLEIGGGSNWWYHPVWWMVGTFLPWMGALVLAGQTAKSGAPNPGVLAIGTFVLAAVFMVAGVLLHVPGARYGLGTFAVSVLPALALMAMATGFVGRRR
jgi:hypothetical protein